MNLATAIASNKSGRILLHAVCLLRRPRHAGWHWGGIVREVSAPSLRGTPLRALSIAVALSFLAMAWSALAAF